MWGGIYGVRSVGQDLWGRVRGRICGAGSVGQDVGQDPWGGICGAGCRAGCVGQDVGQDSWRDLWGQYLWGRIHRVGSMGRDPWGRMWVRIRGGIYGVRIHGAGCVGQDSWWNLWGGMWGGIHGAGPMGRAVGQAVGWAVGQAVGVSQPLSPHSYATDLVVCVALGCDMFDCVFPTRTAVRSKLCVVGGPFPFGGGPWDPPSPRAPPLVPPQRFGSALVPWGSLQLKSQQFAKDFRPIDERCGCPTCQRWAGFFGGGFLGCGGGHKVTPPLPKIVPHAGTAVPTCTPSCAATRPPCTTSPCTTSPTRFWGQKGRKRGRWEQRRGGVLNPPQKLKKHKKTFFFSYSSS